MEFQYTYWPDPENRTARQQEFINVRISGLFIHVLRVCPPHVSVFSVQILGNLECLCIDILVIDVLEFSVVFSNVF